MTSDPAINLNEAKMQLNWSHDGVFEIVEGSQTHSLT